MGSVLLTFGLARIGIFMLVLNSIHFNSTMLLRVSCYAGPVVFVFGLSRPDAVTSLLDPASIGSSTLPRGLV